MLQPQASELPLAVVPWVKAALVPAPTDQRASDRAYFLTPLFWKHFGMLVLVGGEALVPLPCKINLKPDPLTRPLQKDPPSTQARILRPRVKPPSAPGAWLGSPEANVKLGAMAVR